MILRVNNLNSKCDNCKRPRYQHIVYYYFNKIFVKIACELTGMSQVQNFNIEEQLLRETTEIGGKDNHFEFGKDAATPKSSYTKEISSPLQKSFTFTNTPKTNKINLRKLTAVSLLKVDVKTYIECNACRSILTKETQLSQNYLEYSFTRYLLHFFLNNQSKDDKQEIEEGNSGVEDSNKCKHKMKNRIFDYNGVLIKMSSGFCKFYHLDKIKDIVADSEKKANLETAKSNLVTLKKEEFKAKIKNFSYELIKIIENSSNSVKANAQPEKKSILVLKSFSQSQIHVNEEWKSSVDVHPYSNQSAGEFEDLDKTEDDENEYYPFFENPHITFNVIENSIVMLGNSEYLDDGNMSSKGLESTDLHKIDHVESSTELNIDELNSLELALNDKSIKERQKIYKKIKMDFAVSPHYSENINKAKWNIVSFLQLIIAKINVLTNNFLIHLNKNTFKSYMNIENLRFKYMRKICEILTIIHFLSHEKNKKTKSKGQDVKSLKSSKKIIETMKNSMHIPDPKINEEDDDGSHREEIKILNIEEENESQGECDDKEDDSPQNLSKILQDNSFKALLYTPQFQNLYNELNKGRVFVDNKEGKNYKEFQKFVL